MRIRTTVTTHLTYSMRGIERVAVCGNRRATKFTRQPDKVECDRCKQIAQGSLSGVTVKCSNLKQKLMRMSVEPCLHNGDEWRDLCTSYMSLSILMLNML